MLLILLSSLLGVPNVVIELDTASLPLMTAHQMGVVLDKLSGISLVLLESTMKHPAPPIPCPPRPSPLGFAADDDEDTTSSRCGLANTGQLFIILLD
jgi:hypothetical protein